MSKPQLSLFELNNRIKEALIDAFPVTNWVVAEISEIRQNRSGHCYMELIEKDEATDQIIAKSRATIWSSTYRMLKPYFEITSGESLKAGLRVLLNVTIEFHELYSFSLNVKDIDPTYTMGDLARKKLEIIERLEDEGVIKMNAELELSELPQRIAIISSETAAGLDDFINQIEGNEYGYKFYLKVFPAIVQGAKAEESIMQAFDRVYEHEDFFDAVALIRGGGSKSDLSCFDHYDLAYYITQFPLPVITGIGHERDDSIADLVAHTRMKTPTAVAEFFISKIGDFESHVDELGNAVSSGVLEQIDNAAQNLNQQSYRFVPLVNRKIGNKKEHLSSVTNKLSSAAKAMINKQHQHLHYRKQELSHSLEQQSNKKKNRLKFLQEKLSHDITTKLMQARHQLAMFASDNDHLDPQHILNRGYSMTTFNGKIVTNAEQVAKSDVVITRLSSGKIKSKVVSKE